MVDVLNLFKEKGFFLEKELLDVLRSREEKEVVDFVNLLISENKKERVVGLRDFEGFNRGGGRKDIGFEVLTDVKFLSNKVSVGDFVKYFCLKYEILKEILEKKGVDDLISIRKIERGGVYSVIVMINKKRVTKNGNLLIEVEDLTGRCLVLINKERKDLFKIGESLMLDDVVLFRVSGSREMLFVSDIVFPDLKLDGEKFGDVDEYVAFSGDLHVGSKGFLEKEFLRFIDWLNGGVGDKRQREIALKVKYLILSGDIVDGVGVYRGQEGDLDIKNIKDQYERVFEILNKIRKDVKIIMCAGQHDAVWVGEPQKTIYKKWAGKLYEMENLFLINSPSFVNIEGFNVLIYHGVSVNKIRDLVFRGKNLNNKNSMDVLKEILRRGCLSSPHGVMDYVPCEENYMVLKDAPDIFVIGDQHCVGVESYNNVLMVMSSCWQKGAEFEEKIGNISEPCKVPLFNLKTREVKVFDFSLGDIKWEEGEGLVCKLRGKNE